MDQARRLKDLEKENVRLKNHNIWRPRGDSPTSAPPSWDFGTSPWWVALQRDTQWDAALIKRGAIRENGKSSN